MRRRQGEEEEEALLSKFSGKDVKAKLEGKGSLGLLLPLIILFSISLGGTSNNSYHVALTRCPAFMLNALYLLSHLTLKRSL